MSGYSSTIRCAATGVQNRLIRIMLSWKYCNERKPTTPTSNSPTNLGDIVVLQHLHRLAHFVAGAHYGVEEEDLPTSDVVGKLCKYNMSLVSVGVRVNQDLA